MMHCFRMVSSKNHCRVLAKASSSVLLVSSVLDSYEDLFKTEPLQIGSRQAKKCLRTCAKCSASDHPAHAQSIIRAFAVHSYILYTPMILFADREDPD